jgi:serine/threonine protein phosphatase 1
MRTLAIGDIHGCLHALQALLAAVKPQPEDQLITMGDYVDRGPDSRGVLDFLVELDRGGRLVALRGNHDQMLLEARDRPDGMWLLVGGRETLLSYGIAGQRIAKWASARKEPVQMCEEVRKRVPPEHWAFLEERCAPYHETESHFFVHANAAADVPLCDQPNYLLYWEKLLEPCAHYTGKIMVCGHTKQRSGRPLNLGTTICIDTGIYEPAGWLTCLDVGSGKYWQANQRGEVRCDWLEEAEESE